MIVFYLFLARSKKGMKNKDLVDEQSPNTGHQGNSFSSEKNITQVYLVGVINGNWVIPR